MGGQRYDNPGAVFATLIFGNLFFIGLQVTVLLAWRSRMSRERRERIWPWQQWAVLLTQPTAFAVPVAFAWITRRKRGYVEGLRALALGLALLIAIYLAAGFAMGLFAGALGVPDEALELPS
jgi:hypothetical protein